MNDHSSNSSIMHYLLIKLCHSSCLILFFDRSCRLTVIWIHGTSVGKQNKPFNEKNPVFAVNSYLIKRKIFKKPPTSSKGHDKNILFPFLNDCYQSDTVGHTWVIWTATICNKRNCTPIDLFDQFFSNNSQ